MRYFSTDPYLNLYFRVLLPREPQIRANDHRMFFSTEVLASRTGYYIPDFSGKAFELLLTSIIEAGRGNESRRTQGIFERLGLRAGRYDVGTYWEPGRTQIDIVVRGFDDREVRIIAAKWLSAKANRGRGLVGEVTAKRYPFADGADWRRRSFLAVSGGVTDGLRSEAAARDVGLIELQDLF